MRELMHKMTTLPCLSRCVVPILSLPYSLTLVHLHPPIALSPSSRLRVGGIESCSHTRGCAKRTQLDSECSPPRERPSDAPTHEDERTLVPCRTTTCLHTHINKSIIKHCTWRLWTLVGRAHTPYPGCENSPMARHDFHDNCDSQHRL